MAYHLHMIEARAVRASVGVTACRAVSTVSIVAGTAVQAWSIMIAFRIWITVVQLVSFTIHYHGTGATSLCVSSAASACI